MAMQALEIAKSALLTHRAAVEIAAHNVANAETEGYVRRRADLSPIPGNLQAGAESSGLGNGVELAQVQRLQDDLLGVQVNAQTARKGSDQARADTLGQVDELFNDATAGGIGAALGELFNAFGRLGATPALPSAREDALQRCSSVAESINQRADDLVRLAKETETRIQDDVTQVNELAGKVAELNAKLGGADNTAAANDLQDLRDQAVTKLAALCGAVSVPEAGGVVDVVIGGQRLVQGNHSFELTLTADPSRPGIHQVTLQGETNPRGLSGSLAGRIQARDADLPTYTKRLDTLAQSLADMMNAQHAKGYDLQGVGGKALFEYDATAPASTLKVNAAIAGDPSQVAAAGVSNLAGDGSNAFALQELRNSKTLGGGLQTAEEYNADLVTLVGNDAAHATDTTATRTQLLTSLQTRYQEQAGVSLDEEAIEVMRYQRAYQAAAKIVDVSLQMIDSVLELGR